MTFYLLYFVTVCTGRKEKKKTQCQLQLSESYLSIRKRKPQTFEICHHQHSDAWKRPSVFRFQLEPELEYKGKNLQHMSPLQ